MVSTQHLSPSLALLHLRTEAYFAITTEGLQDGITQGFSACVFRESASLPGLFFACTYKKVALSLALSLIIVSYLKLNTTSRLKFGEKIYGVGEIQASRVTRKTS